MRICVVGAGAIGGLLAAKLQHAGEDVSVIARGPHLAAIKAGGLRLIEEGGNEIVARVKATDRIGNTETPRIKQVSETLKQAGFRAPVVSDIRTELWTKLWGNLSFNPISALTHATLEDLCRYSLTRDLVAAMMLEAQNVGEALGI